MPRKKSPLREYGTLLFVAVTASLLVACGKVYPPAREETPPLPSETPLPSSPDPTASATPFPSATPTATATFTITPQPPTITPTPPYFENFVIGESVQGRPLAVFRFGTGPSRRMVVAGIHGGMEANTTKLAKEMLVFLRDHPDWLPENVTLYILPLLNPDGAALGNIPEGRANANFVDLNRNWDSNWQADPNRSGCWSLLELSTGDYPQSEPETQALATFLLDNDVEMLISYHSAGNGIYPGGQPPITQTVALAQSLAAVSEYAYPPIDAGCAYTGQLIDWAADHGIVAVDIELPNKWETHFDTNIKILWVFVRWE